MKKIKKIVIAFFLFFVTLSSLVSVGYSDYILGSHKDSQDFQITNSPQIVTCINSVSNEKFISIEKALEKARANDVINVLPGTNPIITRNCTIKEGVTLCLPFEKKADGSFTYEERQYSGNNNFADANQVGVNTNRKSLLTISKDVCVTNFGSLIIGGQVGTTSQKLISHTSGFYSEINMHENSSIINNGTINLLGYIKESYSDNNSYVINNKKSIFKTPLVVYDFRGGSYSYAAYKEKIMPFSNFDLPNCHVLNKFEYGSDLFGLCSIYAGDKWTVQDILILSNESKSCLFKLKKGTVTFKYKPINNLFTTDDYVNTTTDNKQNRTYITINGDLSLASLEIKFKVLGEIVINSADFDCPISSKYHINLETGTLNIDNKMKFLKGCEIVINNGATLNIFNSVSAYSDYMPNIKYAGYRQPALDRPAKIINNGELYIDSSFGGLVESNNAGATVRTTTNYVSFYDTKEGLESRGSAIFASMSSIDNHKENASALIKDLNDVQAIQPFKIDSTYEYGGEYWFKKENSKDIERIRISPNTGSTGEGKAGDFNLRAEYEPVQTTSKNIEYYWGVSSTDAQLVYDSNPSSANNAQLKIPANNGESDIAYTVELKVKFINSRGEAKTVTTNGTFTARKKGGGCFAKGTNILCGDGSYKKIEDLKVGDLIKTFNHHTGFIENQRITYIPHREINEYKVLKLNFDNGVTINVLFAHGFMNYYSKMYEEINYDNVNEKIGNSYVFFNGTDIDVAKLISYNVQNEITESYSLASAYNLNHIVEGALCISDDIEGLYNYFELDETFKYDSEKMQRDLETYSYLDYKEVCDFMPYEIYETFNVKYLSVSIGKGMITISKMKEYISKFA